MDLGIKFIANTTVISAVRPGGFADAIGLRSDDVILGVRPGGRVDSAAQLEQLVHSISESDFMAVTFERDGEVRELVRSAAQDSTGLPPASANTPTSEFRPAPRNFVRLRGIESVLTRMWVWIGGQSLLAGLLVGYLYGTYLETFSNCVRACQQFRDGSALSWLGFAFGTVAYLVSIAPLAFIVQSQREVVRAVTDLGDRLTGR